MCFAFLGQKQNSARLKHSSIFPARIYSFRWQSPILKNKQAKTLRDLLTKILVKIHIFVLWSSLLDHINWSDALLSGEEKDYMWSHILFVKQNGTASVFRPGSERGKTGPANTAAALYACETGTRRQGELSKWVCVCSAFRNHISRQYSRLQRNNTECMNRFCHFLCTHSGLAKRIYI